MSDVAFGLDLGGSALKYGVVARTGRVVAQGAETIDRRRRMPGIRSALREAVSSLETLAREHGVSSRCIGAGSAGTLVGPRGKLVTPSPSLPFMRGFEVAGFLHREAGLPAVAENDATVAALAEFRLGAGRGVRSLLMATVGTGLGGGLVVNGELIRGRFGTAGEIGHGIFQPDGVRCGCGSRGCLEQYTASRALKRFYGDAGGDRAIRISDLIERARAGERRALSAVRQAARNLGIGLATCATLVPIDVIAIGGGVSVLGEILLEPLRVAFERHALPYVRKSVRIVPARLGNRAGMVGAALLAFDLFAPRGRRKGRSRAG